MIVILQRNRYLYNVFIALDQLLNALTGGDPDETLSSRIAKKRPAWWAMLLCQVFDLVVEDCHCDKAIEKDEGKDAILKALKRLS